MEGPSIHDAELAGVIPRTVREIFFAVEQAPDSLEFVIKVSGHVSYTVGNVVRHATRPARDPTRLHQSNYSFQGCATANLAVGIVAVFSRAGGVSASIVVLSQQCLLLKYLALKSGSGG